MKINIEKLDNGHLLVNSDFAKLLRENNINTAADLWNLNSEPVKNVISDRRTDRVWLRDSGSVYRVEAYIKRYQPFTLTQAFKALASFKKPRSFDAIHEWNVILAFHRIGIPTMIPMAAARIGRHTCNLTLGITDYIRASDIVKQPDLTVGERHKLIKQIATITGVMHRHGFAHQDLYLVHIFLSRKQKNSLFLIDLQRVIRTSPLKERWRIKDLAQLFFSARESIDNMDIAQFISTYSHAADIKLYRHKTMLEAIRKKADRIEKHHRKRYQQA